MLLIPKKGIIYFLIISVINLYNFFVGIEKVHAEELYEYNENIRSLGMGGVRIPTDNEAGILLYNPAGLGIIKGMNWTVFNLGAGVNGLQIMNDISSVGNMSGISSMSGLYGKKIWLGAGGYSSLVFPYFGFAAYDSGFGKFHLSNPAFPVMNVDYFNDYGFIFGIAIPITPNFYFGTSVKRIDRTGASISMSSDQLLSVQSSTLMDQINNEGIGWGFDVGILFQAPTPFSPTFSIVWKDLGYTTFNPSKGTQTPPQIKDNMILGLSLHGEVPLLAWSGGLEYRHISSSDEPLGKKIHLGTEISIAFINLRAGFFQGYTTYGLGMDLLFFQFNLATYSVEKGAYPGQTPDERIQVGLSFDMSFDPSFKFLEGGGQKRRLKQRR